MAVNLCDPYYEEGNSGGEAKPRWVFTAQGYRLHEDGHRTFERREVGKNGWSGHDSQYHGPPLRGAFTVPLAVDAWGGRSSRQRRQGPCIYLRNPFRPQYVYYWYIWGETSELLRLPLSIWGEVLPLYY